MSESEESLREENLPPDCIVALIEGTEVDPQKVLIVLSDSVAASFVAQRARKLREEKEARQASGVERLRRLEPKRKGPARGR
jgi:hypothetical protein